MGVVFKGDHEPLKLYKGDTLVQNPLTVKKSGTSLTFEKSYNHQAEVEVAGKSVQNGTPTPDNPVPIESIDSVELVSRGRNLLDPSKIRKAAYSAGVPVIPIWMTGKPTFPYKESATTYGIGYIVNAKAGESYTASYKGSNPHATVSWATYTDESMISSSANRIDFVNAGRGAQTQTISVNADCTILFLWASNYYDDEIVTFNSIDELMIESGTATHPYEPYRSTTRTIDLQGHELRSLPDGTKDELLVHRDGRVELVQVGYLFRSTIGAMNNSDLYPGWMSSAFNDEIGNGLNASVICFSNIGGLRLSGDMAHSIGVNTRGRPGAVWFYNSSFSMTQSEMIAKYPNTEVEMYIKRTEPKAIQLPSIDPLPTYWPTTVIYDQNGNDITAHVKVVA